MEGEFIIVSIISLIGTIFILLVMQKFWLQKWDKNMELEKYKQDQHFRFEKYKIRNRKPKNPSPTGMLGNIPQLLGLAQKLDPEQLGDLIDMFTGEGGQLPETEDFGELIGHIVKSNPEIVSNFLQGVAEGQQKGQTEQNIIIR